MSGTVRFPSNVQPLELTLVGFRIPCARTSMPEASISFIHLNYTSLADKPDSLDSLWATVLEISDGGRRVWLLPIEECQTWYAFTSHFVGLGLASTDGWKVKYRDVVLGQLRGSARTKRDYAYHDSAYSSDWATVISLAKRTRLRLTLCIRLVRALLTMPPRIPV